LAGLVCPKPVDLFDGKRRGRQRISLLIRKLLALRKSGQSRLKRAKSMSIFPELGVDVMIPIFGDLGRKHWCFSQNNCYDQKFA
jgi:hypothetical protein